MNDRSELPNPGQLGCNDRAGAMRIESGYWMFRAHAQFRGDCRTLGPGEYPRLPREVDGRIASARRVPDLYGAVSGPHGIAIAGQSDRIDGPRREGCGPACLNREALALGSSS